MPKGWLSSRLPRRETRTFLSETVNNETVQGRKLAVAYCKRVEEVKSCHILYISQSEAERLDRIVSVLNGKPVLTVSDTEGADARGVIVRFEKEHNRINMRSICRL